jgi:hypothetical protein
MASDSTRSPLLVLLGVVGFVCVWCCVLLYALWHFRRVFGIWYMVLESVLSAVCCFLVFGVWSWECCLVLLGVWCCFGELFGVWY